MTRVLLAASECAPLVKTGGLADVIGALPAVLASEGVDARILLPGYPAVLEALGDARPVDMPGGLPAAMTGRTARLLEAAPGGLPLLVFDAPALYDRAGGIYANDGRDWSDNALRFGAFARLAAAIAAEGLALSDGPWQPDVLHAHDWQAGLAPAYLAFIGRPRPSVMTIHNISFQGLFPPSVIDPLCLPREGFTPDGYEFWGEVGFLKAGLMAAEAITTVSPGYAREILTPEFGMGLEGVLAARDNVLSGILNGADTTVWNPASDPALPAPYKTPKGKAASRAALLARFGLPEGPGPVLGVVTRLAWQKGIDLLLAALPGFIDGGGKLVLLGSGDAGLERQLRDAAIRHAGSVGIEIGYDEALSHLIYAGSDAIAVPSRFEPCGLTQLYALRYGALPVVARTGGLGDTVIDASPAAESAGVASGFVHAPGSVRALHQALERLLATWADRAAWERMATNAMRQSVGWGPSAARYAALYRRLSTP
ncbi:MAG: glycogen synthase GlgA [Pseudomonadota bacterium]